MPSSSFGPEGTNPRQRRAYAHAQLARLREGSGSFDEARAAIDAASATRKGKESHFETALINAMAGKLGGTHVFVDWSGVGVEDAAFGGYAMPESEIGIWETLHHEALQTDRRRTVSGLDNEPSPDYHQIFSAGYTAVALLVDGENSQSFQWGRGYDLTRNPAEASLRFVRQQEPQAILMSRVITPNMSQHPLPSGPSEENLGLWADQPIDQAVSPLKIDHLGGSLVYYDSDGIPFYVTGQ